MKAWFKGSQGSFRQCSWRVVVTRIFIVELLDNYTHLCHTFFQMCSILHILLLLLKGQKRKHRRSPSPCVSTLATSMRSLARWCEGWRWLSRTEASILICCVSVCVYVCSHRQLSHDGTKACWVLKSLGVPLNYFHEIWHSSDSRESQLGLNTSFTCLIGTRWCSWRTWKDIGHCFVFSSVSSQGGLGSGCAVWSRNLTSGAWVSPTWALRWAHYNGHEDLVWF